MVIHQDSIILVTVMIFFIVSPCLLAGYDKVKLDVDNSLDKNLDLGKEALLRSTKILGKAASFALFA